MRSIVVNLLFHHSQWLLRAQTQEIHLHLRPKSRQQHKIETKKKDRRGENLKQRKGQKRRNEQQQQQEQERKKKAEKRRLFGSWPSLKFKHVHELIGRVYL